MSSLDLARWQFGITTVYHFLFVPITLGTSFLVAGMQTAWVRTNDEKWLRATKFFGKILLINFAMGVVTGIVQEFQFGMNWSAYSRFVGDIFGAPLAVEGLVAFFLESTFLGLWIFGWDRLPKKLHLASAWLFAIGTALSAYFILAANAFMQHPVGFTYNEVTNRAELTDFIKVLTQPTAYIAWLHTESSSFLVSGALVAGISAYLILKGKGADVARKTLKFGAITTIVAGILVGVTGDMDSKIMVQQQPMKMAAAEGLYKDTANAPFSILTIGDLNGQNATPLIEVPGLLSWLATGDMNATVEGINDLQKEYEAPATAENAVGSDARYPETKNTGFGPGYYIPNIPTTYWSFRLMIGLGMIAVLWGMFALWVTRKERELPTSKWFLRSALALPFLPLLGIAFGWIFTEIGRQPWIVFGQMKTADAVSSTVSGSDVVITMVLFTLLYGGLAVVEMGLLKRAVKQGPPETVADPFDRSDDSAPLTFAY